jgi:hypothetical protein
VFTETGLARFGRAVVDGSTCQSRRPVVCSRRVGRPGVTSGARLDCPREQAVVVRAENRSAEAGARLLC